VDNSVAPGIGQRLDGWPKRTLNVGAIIALSSALADKSPGNILGPAGTMRGFTPLRHGFHPVEWHVDTDPDSSGNRPAGSGIQDVHRRRADLVLE
jgi:hypothetical protein